MQPSVATVTDMASIDAHGYIVNVAGSPQQNQAAAALFR
jgi:hypothetical protein